MSDKFPGGLIQVGAPAGFSVAFDGSGDYLRTPSSTSFALGTSDFTFETWVYPTAAGTGNGDIWDNRSGGIQGFILIWSTGNVFRILVGAPNAWDIDTSTSALSLNQWYHYALTRSGTTFRIFLNGSLVYTSGSISGSMGTSATTATICNGNSATEYFPGGYLSNLRLVKGTALYTASFTPPTQLFPVTNTVLLTCQSPTIIDNSTNAFAISTFGDAKVSNFTPFAAYTGFNPALGAAAGGVWTLDEAAYYQNNRKWPIYDPYFNQTTLMLHGNGTNAAQNNTFLDSSTNNFTITRNGNTTQGTFTPFSQTGWSTYFPGSGTNYVQTPSNTTSTLLGGSLTSLGSLSFTIECYINTPGNIFLVGACDPTGGTADMILSIGSDGTLSFGATFSGYTTRTSTGAAPLNTWCHVAWVVTGGYVNFYVNGTSVGSATVGNTAASYGQLVFSGYNNSFTSKLAVSNFRITKSAIYTSAFTPPTGPLTASTNTTLLTFQGNNYKDFSANNYALTVVGAPTIQAFSPFVPTVTTPTTYSNWFDGSGDSLSLGGQTAFAFGTGDFTIECWIYMSSGTGAEREIIDFRPNSTNGAYPMVMVTTGNILAYYVNTAIQITGTTTVALNTWHHVALARSGTSTKLFLNGIQEGSTYTDTVTYLVGSSRPIIGSSGFSGANYFAGTMSNLRVLKGTALYTAAFTPPNAPLTNITNTSLLTCQSSTFIDNSTNAFTITPAGDVKPVTSPTPFPAKVDTTTLNSAYSTSLIGGSAYFDGSGDNLTAPQGAAFQFPGDFTIECWVYANNSTGGASYDGVFDTRSGNVVSSNSAGVNYTPSGYLNMYVGGANTASSTLLGAKQWVHVALVRSGSAVTMYQNGVSVATATTSTNLSDGYFTVGGFVSSGYWNGYISNVRVVKGTAVYTKAFAPPLVPLTAISNTQLLLSTTNAGIFDNTAKNVLETVGNAQISTTQSKWGGASMAFDGTGDWLQIPYSATGDLGGTTQFTIEFWVYMNSLAARGTVAARNNGSTAAGSQFDLNIETTGQVNVAFYTGGSTISINSATGVITTGRWIHVVLSKDNVGNYKIFVDGTQSGSTTTNTGSINSPTIPMTIGAQNTSGGVSLNGYIDDLRITRGVARYLSNFTPPTSQLQDQ